MAANTLDGSTTEATVQCMGVMGLVTIRPVTVISSFPLSRSVSRSLSSSLSSSLSRLSLFLFPSAALTRLSTLMSLAVPPPHILPVFASQAGAQYEPPRTRPPEQNPRTLLVSSFCAGCCWRWLPEISLSPFLFSFFPTFCRPRSHLLPPPNSPIERRTKGKKKRKSFSLRPWICVHSRCFNNLEKLTGVARNLHTTPVDQVGFLFYLFYSNGAILF